MIKTGMILKHEGFYDDFEYGELFYVFRFKPEVFLNRENSADETTMISFKTGRVFQILYIDYEITKKEWSIVFNG